MNNDIRQIKPLPTQTEVQRLIDAIVVPGYADDQVRPLIELLYSTANAESNLAYEIAETAARYAFTKTDAFEDAFRQFAGFRTEIAHLSQATIQIDKEV